MRDHIESPGKGEVMSFEDLVVARAYKAEKEAATENKKKEVSHHKRRIAKLEADKSLPKVTRIGDTPKEARATAGSRETTLGADVVAEKSVSTTQHVGSRRGR